MKKSHIQIHPKDNIIVALSDLPKGETIEAVTLVEPIPAKHKFATTDFSIGDEIYMYGVIIGKATQSIPKGGRISTENITHATQEYQVGTQQMDWQQPNIASFKNRQFKGYHRANGQVGTMNYWIVVPLVFCENRNIKAIEKAMLEQLGYASKEEYYIDVKQLGTIYKNGGSATDILEADILKTAAEQQQNRLFKNVDGIKFLYHEGGCGCTRQDSETLCQLIAGYINNPNVAGATILSLGCQNAQPVVLEKAIRQISGDYAKPVYILEQQKSTSEPSFIAEAVKKTFLGLIEANKTSRQPADLNHLCIGLECGGSDGFSGISANPTLGHTSDLVVALGGTTILSEFPELNGVEQELVNRCANEQLANKFSTLMQAYSNRAEADGSSFAYNPSPGNIRDGLITDAMKSAGAAKKGGTSPVADVLDYTEPATKKGLNLLCTPGNDVESTTGLAGSGANIILFTTGLGTPTGNPIAPVIKVATNTTLAKRMADIIDFNTGDIITGETTIEEKGEALLDYIIQVASGEATPRAVALEQDDFIPWKRGISL